MRRFQSAPLPKLFAALATAFLLMATVPTLTGCASDEAKSDQAAPAEGGDAGSAGNAGDPGAAGEPGASGDAAAAAPPADGAPKKSERSLFDRVGGQEKLTEFADKFVDAMGANPVITKNPKVAAAFKGDLSGLKASLAKQLCQVSGGPCKYSGRSMKEAHQGLGISQTEWKAMGGVFIKVARDLGLGKRERMELANLVSMTKYDVISSGGGEAPPAADSALPPEGPPAEAPTADGAPQ